MLRATVAGAKTEQPGPSHTRIVRADEEDYNSILWCADPRVLSHARPPSGKEVPVIPYGVGSQDNILPDWIRDCYSSK